MILGVGQILMNVFELMALPSLFRALCRAMPTPTVWFLAVVPLLGSDRVLSFLLIHLGCRFRSLCFDH